MTRLRVLAGTTFRSLRVRNYRLYFLGQVISASGTWMHAVALGLLVLSDRLHGNGFNVGLVTALQFLQSLLFAVISIALCCCWQQSAISAVVGYGISALFTCEGLLTNGDPASRHIVIDPNQETRFANCGLQFLEEAGVSSLVEHYAEQSQITLPRFLSEGHQFDLAVVDGTHRFDAVFLDLAYLGRLLHPGGIVFLDDYHLPAITRAASFFLANLGWALEEVSTAEDRHHWAVLRTSTTPDIRPFDYFADF